MNAEGNTEKYSEYGVRCDANFSEEIAASIFTLFPAALLSYPLTI